ncbi:DNA/RNA-binding protein Alba-like [Dillenia turbinata]|uniref:DNA/RNA-binding protein Alba-like n=1 Tax=Dillenia turbinata TaxID=194707 RepID=A0AAN8UBX1_9MAGN
METSIEVAVAVGGKKKKRVGGKKYEQKKNSIQVSSTKKPLVFYLNLAKKYIRLHNDVELSALGMAIPIVVTIAEILKSNGLASQKSKNHAILIRISTVDTKDESRQRTVQKPKIEIVLEKTEDFDNLIAAAAATRRAAADE